MNDNLQVERDNRGGNGLHEQENVLGFPSILPQSVSDTRGNSALKSHSDSVKEPGSASLADETIPFLSKCPESNGLQSSQDIRKGHLLMLFSAIGFSALSILQRLAQTQFHITSGSALFIRGSLLFICTTIILPFMTELRSQWNLPLRIKVYLLLRGILGATVVALNLISLKHIPAGDSVAIFFTSPVFTMFFAKIFLAEPITWVHGFASCLSILGCIILTSPNFETDPNQISAYNRLVGSSCALLAAIFLSTVYIFLRKIGTSVHYMTSIFSLSICITVGSICAGAAINPFALSPSEIPGVVTMIFATIFAFAGQIGLNRGIQLCPAGPGALIRNIDVPLVYFLAVLFLHEVPSVFKAFGALLIFFSAVIVALQKVI